MADYTEIVEKIKPKIAFVSIMNDGTFVGQGSGFVFAKNRLVTCNHVVSDMASGKANKIFLSFADSPKELIPIEAKVSITHPTNDIAVLEFNDISREPLEIHTGPVKEGMNVIFSGFPLGLKTLTTHQGIISSITTDTTGASRYLIDGTVNTGNSGCPLMSTEGKLIGVINATQREGRDLLDQVASMEEELLVLQGIDLIKVYQAIIRNLQLGIGYAVPCKYIPQQQ